MSGEIDFYVALFGNTLGAKNLSNAAINRETEASSNKIMFPDLWKAGIKIPPEIKMTKAKLPDQIV